MIKCVLLYVIGIISMVTYAIDGVGQTDYSAEEKIIYNQSNTSDER